MGFLARFDFGFSEVLFSANEAKGLLIIASFATFRDDSGRSSYFTREFFYREGGGPIDMMIDDLNRPSESLWAFAGLARERFAARADGTTAGRRISGRGLR